MKHLIIDYIWNSNTFFPIVKTLINIIYGNTGPLFFISNVSLLIHTIKCCSLQAPLRAAPSKALAQPCWTWACALRCFDGVALDVSFGWRTGSMMLLCNHHQLAACSNWEKKVNKQRHICDYNIIITNWFCCCAHAYARINCLVCVRVCVCGFFFFRGILKVRVVWCVSSPLNGILKYVVRDLFVSAGSSGKIRVCVRSYLIKSRECVREPRDFFVSPLKTKLIPFVYAYINIIPK